VQETAFLRTSEHKKFLLNRCSERCTEVIIQVAERNIMFFEMLCYESSNKLRQIELMAKFEPAMSEHVRRSVNNEKISLWVKHTSAKLFDSEVVWERF